MVPMAETADVATRPRDVSLTFAGVPAGLGVTFTPPVVPGVGPVFTPATAPIAAAWSVHRR